MGFLSFYKQPQPRGYDRGTFYIEDTSETSPLYFDITYCPYEVGGGVHVIKLKGNGLNLKNGSTIDIEIKDADGRNVFAAVTDYVDRFDDYYNSFEIYDLTARGLATVYLVGEATVDLEGNPIPTQFQGQYNVRFQKQMKVLPMERNDAQLIFNTPPEINIVQVTTPERSLIQQSSTGSLYSLYTSSRSDMTIVSAENQGSDRDFQSSEDILDVRLKDILINPLQKPSTANTVNTSLRKKSDDIQNGYIREFTSRFNTVVRSADRTLQKDFLGGTFNFFDSASTTPQVLGPIPPANFTPSGSLDEQFKLFSANIVEVMTDTAMRIDKPLKTTFFDSSSTSKGQSTTYMYKRASDFVPEITYLAQDASYVTSSTTNQSYLETTFTNLKPIGGEVYRIKTYYKKGIASAEYKLIHDNVVQPVEYLTDAVFPNQTSYAKRLSDYRLIGHFTEQYVSDLYWEYAIEQPNAIYVGAPLTIDSGSLMESAPIAADFTQSGLFATKFNQNYAFDQLYTLGFNLTLDPFTELEIYMNSDPLSTNTTLPNVFPRAFLKDTNLEMERHPGTVNVFGKFIGKIINNRPVKKNYGKVEFDFETDGEGFGRPLLRSKIIDFANRSGSAYVSEVSVTPLSINGFSPNLVQFAIPFNNEITDLLAVSQSIDFKIEYFDYTGQQSEYITFLDDLRVNVQTEIPSNQCQAQTMDFLLAYGLEEFN